MTILSDLRSSRFARQQKNITQSLIVFTLRREWFALPIDMVQKVIPLGAVYGDPQGTGISLTSQLFIDTQPLESGFGGAPCRVCSPDSSSCGIGFCSYS